MKDIKILKNVQSKKAITDHQIKMAENQSQMLLKSFENFPCSIADKCGPKGMGY